MDAWRQYLVRLADRLDVMEASEVPPKAQALSTIIPDALVEKLERSLLATMEAALANYKASQRVAAPARLA